MEGETCRRVIDRIRGKLSFPRVRTADTLRHRLVLFRGRMGELEVDVQVASEAVVALWRGKSQAMDPSAALAPIFTDVIARAVDGGVPVIHDFCGLEFFNSATVSAIIRHLKALAERQIHTTVRYDGSLRWQRTFFDALAITAAKTGHLTVVPVTVPKL